MFRRLLPLVLLLVAGCSDPPASAELPFPSDAAGMSAKSLMAEVVGREFPLDDFIHEYGGPAEVERKKDVVRLIYDCRDYSVCLMVHLAKFDAGVVKVIEGEPY